MRSNPREMVVSDATEVVAEALIGSVTGGIVDQKLSARAVVRSGQGSRA